MNNLTTRNIKRTYKDVLYISSNDILSNESIQSDVALFILAFCGSRSFDVVVVESEITTNHNVLQHVEQRTASKAVQRDTFTSQESGNQLSQSALCDWLRSRGVTVTKKRRSQLSEVLEDCAFPATLDSSGNVCRCGLSTVIRRVVLLTSQDGGGGDDLPSLLGFRQTCLKTFADVNVWTKLVDFSLSNEIANEVRLKDSPGSEVAGHVLPDSMKTLEKYLASPVSTFNVHHQEQNASYKERRKRGKEGIAESKRIVSDYKTEHVVVNKKTYRNAIRAYKRALTNGEILPDTTFKNSRFFIPLESWKQEMIKVRGDNAMRIAALKNTDHVKYDIQGSQVETVATKELDRSALLACIATVQQYVNATEAGVECGEAEYKIRKATKHASEVDGSELPTTVRRAQIDDTFSAYLPDTMNPLSLNKSEFMQASKSNGQKKFERDTSSSTAGNCIESHLKHIFAEGTSLTVTDLALFIPVHTFLRQDRTVLHTAVPYIISWYQRMWSLESVKQTAALCGLKEIPFECEVEVYIPDVKKPAAVEYDHGKGKSRKARNHAVKRELPSILLKLEETVGLPDPQEMQTTTIDWSALPAAVSPQHGEVPESRLLKKHQQIENLVTVVLAMAKEGDTIVDFCSGGGHVGITLAYLLPKCHVIMIELNEESLRRARGRVIELELTNAFLFQSNIDYFHKSFEIGVSLHACGVATDIVIDKCLKNNASLVSSPCCYGSINTTESISYPRSKVFRNIPISTQEFLLVAHAAEQTNWDFENENYKRGKLAMSVVDEDRSAYIREHNYKVHLCSLMPATCSPKNNLLVGMSEKHQKNYWFFPFQDKHI